MQGSRHFVRSNPFLAAFLPIKRRCCYFDMFRYESLICLIKSEMGKIPVKIKAVVYGLSPFQQKVMPGLWKELTNKITTKSPRIGLALSSLWAPSLAPTRTFRIIRKERRWSIDIETKVTTSRTKTQTFLSIYLTAVRNFKLPPSLFLTPLSRFLIF
ncbi:unnamed protein product [Lactuca virosa]|uniref:Uncharacterized protein n=1 Tax=Lactuca virosa TaxID=75947 RepID=A0AAU9P9X4_9ASTR|nr:unnamed protein product [Lactuca virosa]